MADEKWVDPIVEEIHRIRRETAARFNFDVAAIFEDARKRQEASRKAGHVVISTPLERMVNAVDQPAA